MCHFPRSNVTTELHRYTEAFIAMQRKNRFWRNSNNCKGEINKIANAQRQTESQSMHFASNGIDVSADAPLPLLRHCHCQSEMNT